MLSACYFDLLLILVLVNFDLLLTLCLSLTYLLLNGIIVLYFCMSLLYDNRFYLDTCADIKFKILSF